MEVKVFTGCPQLEDLYESKVIAHEFPLGTTDGQLTYVTGFLADNGRVDVPISLDALQLPFQDEQEVLEENHCATCPLRNSKCLPLVLAVAGRLTILPTISTLTLRKPSLELAVN